MSDVEKVVEKERPRKGLKVVMGCLGVLAGLVLLFFFGVPIYLSSSAGTNFLLRKVNQTVDGQVRMDDFSLGWFKGVKLKNVSYADSAGNASIQVQQIETHPRYLSLLGGKVKLGKTLIDSPQVYLKIPAIEKQTGQIDKSASIEKAPPAFPLNQIDLKLINGNATIELLDGAPQKVAFTNIASNVQLAEAGKPSSLDFSMNIDEQSSVSVKGNATSSKKGWAVKDGDFNVRISKLELASLKPLFALAGQQVDMSGELNADATIEISQNQVQKLDAQVTVDHFTQGTGDQKTVFEKPITVSMMAGQKADAVQIDKLNIESEFFQVSGDGTLEAMNYSVDADLAQTQRLIGQFTDMGGLAIQGKLVSDGTISMTDQTVKAAGKGSIQQLMLKREDVSTPVTDVQMEFDGTVDQAKNQLRLALANLTAAPGSVKIANLVMPMGEQGDKTISLDAQAKLDLAQTWAYAKALADLPKDLQLAGMLDSAVKVSTEGSRMQLLTEQTRITQLKITQPDSEPFVQEKVSLDADVIVDTDAQTIDIRTLDMQAADGQSLIKVTKGAVKKKISNNMTTVSGDFQAQYDLKSVSAFASAYLPEGLIVEGKRSDTLRFESQYPTDKPELMLANLNGSGQVGFDKARYQGLNFGPTAMKLNIQQGQATIDIPDADVNGGKVRFLGDIDLTEEPMMLRLRESTQVVEKVRIDDVISAQLLKYLNPIFAEATGVSGIASLSCDTLAIPLGGDVPKENIHLVGKVGLTDVRLNSPLLGLFKEALGAGGMNLFSIPPSPFTIKDGLVQYKNMQMMFGNDYVLLFSGSIGLDESLAMNVGVPIDNRRVDVPLGGTLAKPKLDIGKFIESGTRQIIEQEIQRGFERIFR